MMTSHLPLYNLRVASFTLLAWTTIFAVLLLTEGKGNFKTYNDVERSNFVNQFINSKLNEIDASDYYDDIDLSSKPVEIHEQPFGKRYDPNWNSLDARPLPRWYDESKIGIFIHWGVFSVPGLADAWFWKAWTDGQKDLVNYMNANYKPSFTYQEFAPQFTAEFFDPNEWADLFNKSGAKYVVLTSKHHDGFTLYPSETGFGWNAMDVGPHKDLVGDFANAIKSNTSLRFGLYHSLYEWYNPLWMQDKKNNFSTGDFVKSKTVPEMHEIVNTYKPDILWSDGEWEAPDSYWTSEEFLAWLYNDSPVKDSVVTNDRWGSNTMCKHGGFFTCSDKYNPGVLQPRKWENCMTLDKYSWGFRRNAKIEDYLTPEELMTTIAESVSCGGNVLVNVGPTREGIIAPIQQERLLQMGEWLGINGEAIYTTVPWAYQNDTVTPGIWYTANKIGSKVFAMITIWPGSTVHLGAINHKDGMTISMLGAEGLLEWKVSNPGIEVKLPSRLLNSNKSKWVWTLSITLT